MSVDAFEGAELVASAVSSFEMAAASTIALTGALTLASDAVPAGSEVIASYTIENESVIELTSGTVRVELFDAVTVTTVASADAPLTLAGGDAASVELRIDTTGLELGDYSVVLLAGSTTLRSLATAPVTLFATPSAPSVNAPADGASAPQRLLLSVNNATNPNDETLTYEFEIYLDPSLTVRLGAASGLPEGTTTTAWSVLTFLEENRHYSWRARAHDRFATSDWMAPATVFVDSGDEAPDAPVLSAPADTTDVGRSPPDARRRKRDRPRERRPDVHVRALSRRRFDGSRPVDGRHPRDDGDDVLHPDRGPHRGRYVLLARARQRRRAGRRVDGGHVPGEHGEPRAERSDSGRAHRWKRRDLDARARGDIGYRPRRRSDHAYLPDRCHRLVRFAGATGIAPAQ